MSGFFEKPEQSVQRSPQEGELSGLAGYLAKEGKRYRNVLRDFEPGTEAYGAKLRTTADDLLGQAQTSFTNPPSGKTVRSLWDTAENPTDDVLTNFYRDQTRSDVAGELGRYGLIGQGRGAEIMDRALTAFNMQARDRADTRRSGAATTAQNLTAGDFNLGAGQAREAGGLRQEATDAFTRLVDKELAYRQLDVPLRSNLMATDAARFSQEAALTAASQSPFEELVNTLISAYSAYTGGGGFNVQGTQAAPGSPSSAGPNYTGYGGSPPMGAAGTYYGTAPPAYVPPAAQPTFDYGYENWMNQNRQSRAPAYGGWSVYG